MQNSLYEGVTDHGGDERWYKFHVKDRAVINPTFELAEKKETDILITILQLSESIILVMNRYIQKLIQSIQVRIYGIWVQKL